jgi:quercetin dioxygenase-like cupin family protein
MLNKAIIAAGTAAVAVSFAAFVATTPAHAHGITDGSVPANVKILQQHVLPEAPGKTGVMLTVSYKPGEETIAHVHPGSVFAYVLEGEVESGMEGEQTVRYKAGQFWHEAPKHPHMVSRNPSKTRPAKLLVWMSLGEGEGILTPHAK